MRIAAGEVEFVTISLLADFDRRWLAFTGCRPRSDDPRTSSATSEYLIELPQSVHDPELRHSHGDLAPVRRMQRLRRDAELTTARLAAILQCVQIALAARR